MSLQNQNQLHQDNKVRYVKPMTTQYTECYDNYGRFVLDYDAENKFLQMILKNLPDNYYGVDIGSCDGRFGNDIMSRKNGKIISVDPFPVNKEVIKSRGQDFVKQHQNQFDCVIFKHSIHFFQNFDEFYKDLSKTLKPNGKIFVLTILPESKLPWTETTGKGFVKSCRNYDYKFQNHDVEQIIVENVKMVQTSIWKGILQGRGFSNLLQHSEEEIQENINSLPKTKEVELKWKHKILMAKCKNSN